MAEVYPFCNEHVAHMTGVKGAVHEEGRGILSRAKTLFAPHDRPGRHELSGRKQDTDFLVIFEGPAVLSVEYGRGPVEYADGRRVGPAQGLHILGRAARL